VLHFLPDSDQPAGILATLLSALSAGSYLVASHGTGEHITAADSANGQRAYQRAGVPIQLRDSDEFARLAFGDLEFVPPGVVLVSDWRPDHDGPRPMPDEVNIYGGVARKRLRATWLRCAIERPGGGVSGG
jgi:hypothetical protein